MKNTGSRSSERMGEVRGSLSKSEDILILDRTYTDRRLVEADLDEIMGEEVLIRKYVLTAGE